MDDKKTDYMFPVYFGDRCHVGDEMLRYQYLQDLDRSAAVAAVTEVPVTRCNDQQCSYYWTTVNPPADESTGIDKKATENEQHGGNTSAEHADSMGPLNIMAAVIPFEPTWSTTTREELQCSACDVDNCMCSQSFDVLLSTSSESTGTSDDTDRLSSSSKPSLDSSIEIQTFDDDEEIVEEELGSAEKNDERERR